MALAPVSVTRASSWGSRSTSCNKRGVFWKLSVSMDLVLLAGVYFFLDRRGDGRGQATLQRAGGG